MAHLYFIAFIINKGGYMRKIVIDIETTGQSFEKDKIISLVAVEIDEGYRLTGNILCSLVNPKHSIPRQVSIKTGITQATIQNKPSFSELENSFLSFVDGKDIIVFSESESLYFIYTALGFALPNEIVVLSELAKRSFLKRNVIFLPY